MRNVTLGVCALIGIVLAGVPIMAQVYDLNQFKVTVYNQTNASPPAAPAYPNAYYFGTYIDTDPAFAVTNVTVYIPNGNEFALNQFGPAYFENGSPYYGDETNFDTDFPGGTYDYNYTFTDATTNDENADISFDLPTNDLYASSIPAFTPACWPAMQAVDPARDFTLSWNAYTLTPGADYAETFLSINDRATGNAVIGPNGPPEITSTNIPAGTLRYGHVYDVSLFFSERQNPVNDGFGDTFITVGWDNLTQTTLTTLPLWLAITPAGTNVVVTWPLYAVDYHLEMAANLSPAAAWLTVTNAPIVVGSTNVLNFPAGVDGAFFRLAKSGF